MELYACVRVSFPPNKTPYCSADQEIWSLMFEQPPGKFVNSEAFDTIVRFPHPTYTHKSAAFCYGRKDGWRYRLHNQFSKLTIKEDVVALANSIIPDVISSCIGVLYRGEEVLRREQRTGILPSPDQMCDAVERISDTASVFVSADSVEANELFKKRLGSRMLLWSNADRCQRIGEAVHHQTEFGSEHVRKMMALALALSKTHHFVHAVSNIATAVLYFNPWLPHRFVEVKSDCSKAKNLN